MRTRRRICAWAQRTVVTARTQHLRLLVSAMNLSEVALSSPCARLNTENGNVIFVVGAGLSMPAGLPSFKELVALVYDKLGLGFPDGPSSGATDAEIDDSNGQAWDRILGLLERLLGYPSTRRPHHRNRGRDAVAALLNARGKSTKAHESILELSTDVIGRPVSYEFEFWVHLQLHIPARYQASWKRV
jgi:hypothetical protein